MILSPVTLSTFPVCTVLYFYLRKSSLNLVDIAKPSQSKFLVSQSSKTVPVILLYLLTVGLINEGVMKYDNCWANPIEMMSLARPENAKS